MLTKIRWNHTHKLNKFGSKGQLLWRRETTITKFGSLLCLASPKCIFFRILIHCFIYLKCYWSFALKGIMEFWLHRPFTSARAMYFRENEASENPEFVWPHATLCLIAPKRAKTRKRGRPNQILHKICYPLALVLGYYHFAFINKSVSYFGTMPKNLSLGPLSRCKT